jgi:hypothetical protein
MNNASESTRYRVDFLFLEQIIKDYFKSEKPSKGTDPLKGKLKME